MIKEEGLEVDGGLSLIVLSGVEEPGGTWGVILDSARTKSLKT